MSILKKNDYTLIIMAAGMGSRFGGLKQIEPVGPHGEIILDYSISDAVKVGFRNFIFIIKKENKNSFNEIIHKNIPSHILNKINIQYAFQCIDDLPNGFIPNPERTKPWGTGHAVWTTRKLINSPFAVINADDYYGYNAFEKLYYFFEQNDNKKLAMVAYNIENTITEHGTVSRGVCEVDKDNNLISIVERTKIWMENGKIFYDDGKYQQIHEETPVSMNCWGFSSDFITEIEKCFISFLQNMNDPLKDEFYLPSAIMELLNENKYTVTVYNTNDKWHGITYRQDLDSAKKALQDIQVYGQKG